MNPKREQYLISSYSNTFELFFKIMKRKEMIAKQISFDCSTNSLGQYKTICVDNSMENEDTDVRALLINIVYRTLHRSENL